MSAGYASRLSAYPNKGICGLPEQVDTNRSYKVKLQQLVQLIQASKYTVLLTGAGISTSAGIPDFRGPTGIWTIEQQRQKSAKKRKRNTKNSKKDDDENVMTTPEVNFSGANPTITHQIITKLIQGDDSKRNKNDHDKMFNIKFVITQNVDGLHRRSGLSRHYHSVLHGCTFTEVCENCDLEYFRDTDIGDTISFQYTGRTCDVCPHGMLRDTLLDWEDPLPEQDYERAVQHCEKADVVLCLGTSLRITPVSELPLLGKQFIIVNLQATPHDAQATLIVRQRVDIVMRDLYQHLTGCDFMIESDRSSVSAPLPPPTTIERTWKMPSIRREEDLRTVKEEERM